MLKIGLTGNIGSGKSIVSGIFKILQIPVYNADYNAKLFLDKPKVILKIKNNFGAEVIDKFGKINRKYLAEIVFTDAAKLRALNNIIHPTVVNNFMLWIKEQKNIPYVIMESAILFETEYSDLFDKIIVVTSPENIRISRVMKRDNITEADVKKRMKNQMKEKDKIKKADFVIVNNDIDLVIPQVLKIHKALCGS